MLPIFTDWRTKTATIKSVTTTVDATGVPQQTEATVATVEVNYWTDTSNETNVNDKFVDQATGRVLLPPTITVDTTMWMVIDGAKHYITGVDDVAGMGEVLVVKWRREHGG